MEDNARQLISNLYGLLMEMNFHRHHDDVISELSISPSSRVDKHYIKVKQLTAKYKAESNRQYFQKAFDQIQELKRKGIDELRKFLKPSEQQELVPLFRKFEQITESDKESILDDTELLSLIELLKERVDESNE
jgi:type III secretory pathway component EscR